MTSIAAGLNAMGLRTDLENLDLEDRLWRTQKPYRNGVTVYNKSLWGGNGFGTDVTKVAVRDDVVVGIYESGQTHVAAYVIGNPDLLPDFAWSAGRRYTTKTRLQKWTAAVKALT